MTRYSTVLIALMVSVPLAGGTGSSAFAQGQPPAANPAPQAAPQQSGLQELQAARQLATERETAAMRQVIPLQIQIVISKFQGEKKVSSLPYLLSVNTTAGPGNGASLRMGTQVAIPSTSTNDGKTVSSYSYRDIGTNIDCSATARSDGSFNVNVTVEESSVYPEDKQTPNITGLPVLRSFQTTNRLILKDGQTSQFTAATDRVNGEIVRIDITLKMLK